MSSRYRPAWWWWYARQPRARPGHASLPDGAHRIGAHRARVCVWVTKNDGYSQIDAALLALGGDDLFARLPALDAHLLLQVRALVAAVYRKAGDEHERPDFDLKFEAEAGGLLDRALELSQADVAPRACLARRAVQFQLTVRRGKKKKKGGGRTKSEM
jgi:hypothetical protein